ncbi:MAG TPA: hypothetical protein VK543_03115 [Puia sp.]|nr:hypothetical protein [Puia sp.]
MPNPYFYHSKIIMRSSPILHCVWPLFLALAACHDQKDKKEDAAAFRAKIDASISCTAIGLIPNDSVLYMNGGGAEYKTSIINTGKRLSNEAEGMV